MTALAPEVHAHVQRLVAVVKMANMLEEYPLKSSVLLCIFLEHHSVVHFLGAKGLNAKDIHKKKMFPIYSGKHLLHKVVNNWVEKFSQGCSKVTDDA
jgi:hypothetical protein